MQMNVIQQFGQANKLKKVQLDLIDTKMFESGIKVA